MPIIPVIDMKGGIVVQAIGGHREQYQPLKSVLTESVRPLDVARAMLKLTGSDKLYIADLDAIMYGREVDASIVELLEGGDAEVWLDAGEHILSSSKHILGTESLTITDWGIHCDGLCIDLRDGVLIWNGPIISPLELAYEAVDAGIKTLIVLDVATVGKNEGLTTLNLCQELRQAFPNIQLWTGGGVRSMEDVQLLERNGVEGVLVASALHQGRIKASDL